MMLQKTRILVLCTGNSARSQMAEGFLRSLDASLEVFSAGTRPERTVNPSAVQVMKEIGIDIGSGFPKSVNRFLQSFFDYVITVCDDAHRGCPAFTGQVGHRLHIGFADPARATGSEDEVLDAFCRVRDQIREHFFEFCERELRR